MKKKHKIIASTVSGLLIILGLSFFLFPATISREEAQEIAISHVEGASFANRPELDFEFFRRAWSVEVIAQGNTHEVYVDTQTGEILGIELH
ncbi:MAG: PepSY domain-containing protein [Turicibacter sp.]|nr:PepSY domain-containing protein [Turicibacter sp.]